VGFSQGRRERKSGEEGGGGGGGGGARGRLPIIMPFKL
jgi:hypothetical protein